MAHELALVTQLLWANIFTPPPPTPSPASEPAVSNTAARLTVLYTWFRSLSRSFVPEDSAFDINNDALQRANIRLAHIVHLGSVILLSRLALVRCIERGETPRDPAAAAMAPAETAAVVTTAATTTAAQASRRDSTSAQRKGELDDLQYAEGCIHAAINTVTLVHALVSTTSPASALSVFADCELGVRDVRCCRAVLGVFYVATLTVLLHLSIRPEHHDPWQCETLLERISLTISDFETLPETAHTARHYRDVLRPFVNALSGHPPSPQPHDVPYHCEPAGEPITGPRSASGRKVTADLAAMLRHGHDGSEWFPYHSPLWCWQDLLMTPAVFPVLLPPPRRASEDDSQRDAVGDQGPQRPAKRQRIADVCVDVDGEMVWTRDNAERLGAGVVSGVVSRVKGAGLFRRSSDAGPPRGGGGIQDHSGVGGIRDHRGW